MAVSSPSDSWIGASVLRKEDARHLLGHGMFIADLRIPGVQDVAFVRSDMAHANVRRVIRPPGTAGHVFTLDDLGPLNILEAGPELAAHRHSPYPALADERVRYVGQPIAACVQPTRAQAEDLADRVSVELDELPAVVGCVAAMRPGSPRVFDEWPDNAYITSTVREGNAASLASIHARDHYYDLIISAELDGTLLGIEGDVYIDAGAYALWPTGAFQEASMASRNLTGPYRIRHLNLNTYTVATNKAPMGPYRG